MKNITIIGTGSMGKGLAGLFAKHGHTVYLGSRDAEHARTTAASVHPSVQGMGNLDAARQGDIVFLAIPFQAGNPLLAELREALRGKIVVDISNPLNAEYNGLTTAPDTSALESVAAELPESRVVGAFKNTLAAVFGAPLFDTQKTAVWVSGDDAEAKQEIIKLVNALPFAAWDAGDAKSARTVENMTVLLLGLSMRYDLNWHAGFQVLSIR